MPKARVSGRFDRAGAPPVELAFPRAEYEARWRKTQELMRAEGLDLLYVTHPAAMCWLHGYYAAWYRVHAPTNWGPFQGTAMHARHPEPVHFDQLGEDPLLYKTSVSRDNRFFTDRSPEGGPPFIVGELKRSGLLGKRVGLEYRSFVPNRVNSERLEAAFRAEGCEVVDASMIMREARRLKSPAEIAMIERAMRIAEIGMEAARTTIAPGVTELDVQAEMLAAMHHAGGETAAIPIMVQSGPLIGGHQFSSRRRIRRGEHVMIDMCGVYYRYHGNICRGFHVGEPPKAFAERYRKAAGAFPVFTAAAKAGASVRDVNRALRAYYEDVGLWGTPGWAIGYELGIALPPDWVDQFNFSADEEEASGTFDAGFVGNFESLFDTALIDTYVIEAKGARILSRMPIELIVVGA
jgi:Xaa-Pro aminopeptidase